jgi:hypothetical protein
LFQFDGNLLIKSLLLPFYGRYCRFDGQLKRLFGSGCLPLVLRQDFSFFHMLTVTLMPEVENRASNENGGESSCDDSDYKNKREIINDSCTENPK